MLLARLSMSLGRRVFNSRLFFYRQLVLLLLPAFNVFEFHFFNFIELFFPGSLALKEKMPMSFLTPTLFERVGQCI